MALRFFLDPRLPVPTLTWAQLRERTLRFATALFQLGVRKGDRVAIMLPNCPEFVVAFYGALRIGAIPVNTNPMYVAREMREQFGDSGCETLVLLDQFFPRLREIHAATRVRRAIVVDVTEGLPWPARTLARLAQSRRGERAKVPAETDVSFFHELLRSYPPTPPGASLLPTDVALLQYTGGTTGTPKGAMLTHRNLVANGLQARSWFPRLREEHEVILGAVPLFHAYGLLSVLFLGVAAVAEIVLLPRPRPDAVLEALHRFRPTLFPGVPTLYAGIIDHPRVGEYDLRTGTQCLSGAASLPARVVERFEALTGGRLVEGYGLTETSPLTHGNPIHGERRVGSIGLPVPGTDARIVDLATGEPLPPGGEGELEVRGPQVMLGYWNRPAETAEMIHDGWLRTGDICRMDAGRLLLRRGPPQGHDRRLRLQGLPARGRGGAPHAPRRAGGGGGRGAGRLPGRDGEGLRRPAAGAGGERRRDRRLLPAPPRGLQDPAPGRVPRRAAEVAGGEVPQARAGRGGAGAPGPSREDAEAEPDRR